MTRRVVVATVLAVVLLGASSSPWVRATSGGGCDPNACLPDLAAADVWVEWSYEPDGPWERTACVVCTGTTVYFRGVYPPNEWDGTDMDTVGEPEWDMDNNGTFETQGAQVSLRIDTPGFREFTFRCDDSGTTNCPDDCEGMWTEEAKMTAGCP